MSESKQRQLFEPEPMYRVRTWEPDVVRPCALDDAWTPQEGLPPGPFGKWELRGVLRLLRSMGYEARRGDPAVRVERIPTTPEYRGKKRKKKASVVE